MSEITINGRNYTVPELDFNAVCDLEEKGVNILNMGNDMKIATMVRGLTAWIMNVDLATASREIQAHIQNGGNVMDILNSFTAAVDNSGFFGQTRENRKAIPMDHQKKQNHRKSQRNTAPSQRS